MSAHPERAPSSLSVQRNDSHSPLLSSQEEDASDLEEEDSPCSPGYVGEAGLAPEHAPRVQDVEMSPQHHARRLSAHDGPVREHLPRSLSRGAAITHDTSPNVYGLKLWQSGDFYLLFAILSLCECLALCASSFLTEYRHSSERHWYNV